MSIGREMLTVEQYAKISDLRDKLFPELPYDGKLKKKYSTREYIRNAFRNCSKQLNDLISVFKNKPDIVRACRKLTKWSSGMDVTKLSERIWAFRGALEDEGLFTGINSDLAGFGKALKSAVDSLDASTYDYEKVDAVLRDGLKKLRAAIGDIDEGLVNFGQGGCCFGSYRLFCNAYGEEFGSDGCGVQADITRLEMQFRNDPVELVRRVEQTVVAFFVKYKLTDRGSLDKALDKFRGDCRKFIEDNE